MTDNVVFFLTESDVTDESLKKIKNHEKSIVIPLTFKTIKLLKDKKIEFTLDDSFISSKDFELIDSTSYKIVREWWKREELDSIFNFKEINIALLLERELITTMIKFIHRILLVKKIILEFNPKIVYFSKSNNSISRIPELFQKKNNFIIKNLSSISNETNFISDKFTIGFDIFGKIIDVKFSRKTFFRIKKYYELGWNILYKILASKNKEKNGKKILLIDFNLITHKSILEKLSQSEYDLLLCNTRRPIIWNKESLNIAKNLNFKKITLKNKSGVIHPGSNKIMKEFKQIIEKDDFMENIFSINDITFWKIFEDDFMSYCSRRFSEILFLIDSFNELLSKENIKLLFTLDDYQQIERTVISICNRKNIPSLFLSSTIIQIFSDGKRNWELPYFNKIFANKLAIPGEMSKQICLDHNIDIEKIVITGNPKYDEIFKQKAPDESEIILVALSGFPTSIWSSFLSSSFLIHYEKIIRAVFTSLSKYGKNVIIKVHPTGDSVIDVNRLASELIPEARIYKTVNTYELILKAKVVISPHSTIISESLILEKPVLLLNYLKNDSGIPYTKFKAVLSVESPNEVENKIEQILHDNTIKNELSIGSKKFLNHAFQFQGKSSEQFIKLINNILEK